MSAAISLTLILGIGLVGSSCSRKPNPEAVSQLQEMSSAVQDMSIVVSAGVTKEQYSQRLTDALLKIGNSNDRCKHAIAKFAKPDQQVLAADVCQRVVEAMDAYTDAKEYFGPAYDPIDPDFPVYTLKEEDYAEARKRFPTLEDLVVSETSETGYKFYSRSAMLQALWKMAGRNSVDAKNLLEKLT